MMFQRWLHPGYAPKELHEKGNFGVFSDIYSFGMIGYVMRHGVFYKEKRGNDAFDRILIRCINMEIANPYTSIHEVLQDLACCYRPIRWILKKPKLHIIGCVLCCLVSIMIHNTHIYYNVLLYEKAFKQQDYDEALRLNPTGIDAYVLKLQQLQQSEDNEDRKASLLEIETMMKQNAFDQEETILRNFILCCFACEDPLYYQKVEEYITQITPANKEDAMVLDLYRLIAKERQQVFPDHALKQEIQKQLSSFLLQDINVLIDETIRLGTRQLLQLFEFHMQELQQPQLVRFLTIIEQLRMYETSDVALLDRIWVATMNQMVLLAYAKNDVHMMNEQIIMMRKKRDHLVCMSDVMHRQYGFIFILEFTYGITDIDKAKKTQILDDAMKEWQAIKLRQEYDEQMIRKVEELKREWGDV